MHICICIYSYICEPTHQGAHHSKRSQDRICGCIYICLYMYICICVYVFKLIYVNSQNRGNITRNDLMIVYAGVYTYIYIYIYIYVYMYIYSYKKGEPTKQGAHHSKRSQNRICRCISIPLYIYICIHVYIFIYIYVHPFNRGHITRNDLKIVYVGVYLYLYTYIYIHMCIYIYLYICAPTQQGAHYSKRSQDRLGTTADLRHGF